MRFFPERKKAASGAGIGRMLLFGTGDIYGCSINIYTFFYAKFTTDVIHLDPIYAGVVFLISNIWDAFTDPVMGFVSDVTRSRFGRRRVYFFAGMLPVFLSFFLLWNPVQTASAGLRFAYVLASSMLFKTVYTMVMVPYQAMKFEYTPDYALRNRLALMGMIFSSAGTALAFVLPPLLTSLSGDSLRSYVYMALIMGTLFILPWPLVLISTRGKDNFPPAKRSFKQFVRTSLLPFRFRSFRRLAVMYLTAVASVDLISMLFVYYVDYYLIGSGGFSIEKLIVPVGGALIVQAAVVPLYNRISRRTGKHIAYITGSVLWILGCVVIFLLPPLSSPSSIVGMLPLGILMGGGISGVMIMSSSMLTDMAEVGELHFHERREGMFSGLVLLMRKGSDALTNFFALFFLGLAGYIKPVLINSGGKDVLVKQAQPESAILVIRIFLALVPAFLILLGIFAALRYPLNAKVHGILSFYLKKKREGEEADPCLGELLSAAVIGGRRYGRYNRHTEQEIIKTAQESGYDEKLL